jgi:hypothetical protein
VSAKKTVGYIVTRPDYGPLHYATTDTPGFSHALYNTCETVATVFRSRRSAKSAIEKSRRFWKEVNRQLGATKPEPLYTIVRVEAAL